MLDFKTLPETEVPTASEVRSPQKIIGELTWIASRTWPDVGYHVNRLSRMATTMPKHAHACVQQVIRSVSDTDKRFEDQVFVHHDMARGFDRGLAKDEG